MAAGASSPDASRPTWIVADVHGGSEDASDRALARLLEKARKSSANLLFLGDLFVAWLGPPKFWTNRQRATLEAIEAIRRTGAWTGFVVGNRDYLVKDALEGTVFDEVYDDDAIIDLGGIATMVSHGDRTNPKDTAYLRWHRISRSRVVTFGLGLLPGVAGRLLAARVEAEMRPLNRRVKEGALPTDGLLDFGRRARARGAARALVGHYHIDRVLDVPGGVPVTMAPAWFEAQRLLRLLADGSLQSIPLESIAD